MTIFEYERLFQDLSIFSSTIIPTWSTIRSRGRVMVLDMNSVRD